MAQIAKVEAKVEIKSPANKFYGFFKNNMNRLVQMFPEKIRRKLVTSNKIPTI